MKADASLVQAAFKEGQTRAMADVPSMKPMFESAAKIQKTVMDTITGVMDQVKLEKELESAAKEKRMQPISDLAKGVYNSIYDGGEPLPSIFIDSFTKRIEELQDEFEKVNTEGKGDTKANEKKRREISGEFARLKNEAVNVRKNFMISTQDPEQWNIDRIDDDLEAPLASIFGLWTDSKNLGGVTSDVVNGKLVVTAGGRSFNSEDILKALNYKDKKSDSFVMSGVTDSATLGTADAKKEGALETSTYYNDVVRGQDSAEIIAYLRQNPTAFADMNSRGMEGLDGDVGMKKGLLSSNVLTTDIITTMFVDENGNLNEDLLKAVSALDIAGADGGGSDGIINSEDQQGLKGDALKKFKDNWNIVLDAVTNPDSKYFNKEKSYKMLADYYTNFKEQSYNDAYAAQWKKDNPDKKELTWTQKRARLLYERELLKNPNKITTSKFGLDLDTRMYTLGEDQNYGRVFGRDVENNVETFKAVQSKGSGPFQGWDGSNWMLKDGEWFGYNSETTSFDKPANFNTIAGQLNWSNNPKIMEYLKIQKKENKGTPAPPNPNMIKELKALEMRKGRYIRKEAPMRPEDYEKLVQDIKAKYQK